MKKSDSQALSVGDVGEISIVGVDLRFGTHRTKNTQRCMVHSPEGFDAIPGGAGSIGIATLQLEAAHWAPGYLQSQKYLNHSIRSSFLRGTDEYALEFP
jgi:hypothetical protein